MHTIVIDVETKKDFREVGSRKRHNELGISVAGVYDSAKEGYQTFEEHELSSLENLLSRAELIVGFNIKGFDFEVLQPYFKILQLQKTFSLDILEDIFRYVGYRVSLNSVARATLNTQKSGDGLSALKLYKEGKMDELKKYCLDDVRITKEIYDFGMTHGYVLIKSKDGVQDHKIPVVWKTVAPMLSPHQKLF